MVQPGRPYNTPMPRTRRYIFNTLTVVSLLLVLATVGLWVGLWGLNVDHRIIYWDGHLQLYLEGDIFPSLSTWPITTKPPTVPVHTVHADVGLLGFNYYSDTYRGARTTYVTFAPYLLIFLAAIIPAIWLFKWRRRRKLVPNACPACGYDLTGNESGVCSECGQIIAGKQNA